MTKDWEPGHNKIQIRERMSGGTMVLFNERVFARYNCKPTFPPTHGAAAGIVSNPHVLVA